MTKTELKAILEKLKVGKGGVPGSQRLDATYRIEFSEQHGVPGQLYMCSIYKDHMRRSIGLSAADVFTKSRSNWQRDSVWRLTPATVDRIAENLLQVFSDLREI